MSAAKQSVLTRRASESPPGESLRVLAVVAFLILALVPLSGCQYLPFGYTSLQDIVSNPSAYEGKEVKVRGKVLEVTKIPFVEAKFYTLAADGYQIPVISEHGIPSANASIIVVGKVENIAIINNQSIGLHIREVKRLEKPFW